LQTQTGSRHNYGLVQFDVYVFYLYAEVGENKYSQFCYYACFVKPIGYNPIDEEMNTGCITELAHRRVGSYAISKTSVIIIIIIIIMRFSITCGLTRTDLSRYIRTDYIKPNDNKLPMDVSLLNAFRLSHPPSQTPE
jgi:hypothetical protein